MKSFIKTIYAILLFGLVQVGLSQEKVSFRTNLFTDNSGTSVQSPTVEIVKSLLRDVGVSVRYMLDRLVLPPIRGLSAAPSPTDAVTGASRPITGDDPANQSYKKNRNEVILGLNIPLLNLSS